MPPSIAPSPPEPPWFAPSATTMAGVWDASSIPSDIIGRSASPCVKAPDSLDSHDRPLQSAALPRCSETCLRPGLLRVAPGPQDQSLDVVHLSPAEGSGLQRDRSTVRDIVA